MKKWLFRIGAGLLIVVSGLIILILYGEMDETEITDYTKNENLPTVRENWKGTPIDRKGRFVNVEHPFLPSLVGLLQWQLSSNEFAEEKKSDERRPEILDPVKFLESDADGILWLGHASVYIRLGGRTILIDPVFGNPGFIDKFVEVPDPLEKIKSVDFVLVTHDHRDHCDEPTLKAIARKFPKAEFLGGLRMDELFGEWTKEEKSAPNPVKNAGWYQRFDLAEDLKITFVPVRHWSRRGLFDTNWRLWGGYVIENGSTKIYHGGDSGYGSHYRELAEIFPEIDYFIIGIGAFEPRWFMEANHNNPSDAVRAFRDARAKNLIPMHYGTFDLSDEPPGLPLENLKMEAEKAGVAQNLKILQINEYLEISE